MGRRPIGKVAMTAAERQRRRRKREREKEGVLTKVVRLDDCVEALRLTMWDYVHCLAGHRKQFKPDDEFQSWFVDITEGGDFIPEDVAALLAMADIELEWWEYLDLQGVVRPQDSLEEMHFFRRQNVTPDVTKTDDEKP